MANFTSIPEEPRLKIYAEIGMLASLTITVAVSRSRLSRIPDWTDGNVTEHHEGLDAMANLSQVSRLISAEVISFYYKNGVFVFQSERQVTIAERDGSSRAGGAGDGDGFAFLGGMIPDPPVMRRCALMNVRNADFAIPSMEIQMQDASCMFLKGEYRVFTDETNGFIDKIRYYLEHGSGTRDMEAMDDIEEILEEKMKQMLKYEFFGKRNLAVVMNIIFDLQKKLLLFDGRDLREQRVQWLGTKKEWFDEEE